VFVEKAGDTDAIEHAHAHRFELTLQLLLFVNRVHNTLRTVEQPGEIHFGRVALESICGELLSITPQARRLGENTGRDAAVVGADPTHVRALHQRYLRTQLSRTQSGCYPGRSTTYHHYIKQRGPRFH
jgi:hypothetical protein